MYISIQILCLILSCALSIKRCLPNKPFLRFHKIRSCYKSNMPIISWKNLKDVSDCKKLAREKNGFAFNFSPPTLNNITENRPFRNCQVLGCPETTNTSTFVFDPLFDYYSAYDYYSSTKAATCIRSIGIFNIIKDKRNYTEAVKFCQNIGADLADVLSESRTNALGTALKSLNGWYKAAYVGLADSETEGTFLTPMGNFLDCTKYRAWGVGQPRLSRKNEDCVILDADKVWRAISCKIKLAFICEFYPGPPENPEMQILNEDCTKVKNKRKKRQCLANQELFQMYNSSTRLDQCALINNFE